MATIRVGPRETKQEVGMRKSTMPMSHAEAIDRSLDRESRYFAHQAELESHGRCLEHPQEVRGRCPRCQNGQ